jgi:S-adenosylmethionine:tRNA ribosyltransferase-isomerase
MKNPFDIKIVDYNYELPPEKIAQFPLEDRDASKVLIYDNGKISESVFKNIVEYLPGNSFLVLNNTKVIQARLHFYKETGAFIEIFCLEPHQPELNLSSKKNAVWKCLVGNAGKWKYGPLKKKFVHNSKGYELSAVILDREKDYFIIKFEWNNENITFSDILFDIGKTPLPPYIKRDALGIDKSRYQTVYAEIDGSVAAPTAGLHFTDEVLNKIEKKGTEINRITLNVGTGTFKPVKCEMIKDHIMHSERINVSKEFVMKLFKSLDKPIISVGTTTLRTIETLYWLSVKLNLNLLHNPDELILEQWEPYTLEPILSSYEALEILNAYLERNELDFITAQTGILIAPGYEFKFVDTLMTNFHLPKSTLLLLIAAFVGEDWKKIYK